MHMDYALGFIVLPDPKNGGCCLDERAIFAPR